MRLIVLMTAFLGFVPVSLAAEKELTCKDLEKTYLADEINEEKYTCKNEGCKKNKEKQLRATVKYFHESASGDDMTLAELEAEFDPIYSVVILGKIKLQSVNISLGENPFILFFLAGTTKKSGIESNDGSLSAQNDFCEGVELEPVVNASRRHAICRTIVPIIKDQAPETTFGHLSCANEKEVEGKPSDSTSFYIDRFTKSNIWFSVQRNLSNFNGNYFTCNVRLDRKTNKVLAKSVSCSTP